jgi:N-acetylglucosaminyl-diphospho-decaprenol L-rhamnosyltransferase
MDVSIIYVNWNSLDYLRECIASVYRHTRGLLFEIIVVDNASPEGNVDALKEQFPHIVIIKAETNLGFARANNIGFTHSSGNYVLFLNPDTQLRGPAINTMLRQIQDLPNAGIVGCRLLNTDMSVQLTAIQKFPTILNQVLDAKYLQLRWPHCGLWDIGPLLSDAVPFTRVEVISGACMLLRREVFDQVEMFSEEYFMYAEDIDLNVKVARAGFTNYYVSGAVIVHHGGKSSSRQSVSHWSTIMKYRAMVRLFTKTRGPVYSSVYRTAIGCIAVVRLILLAVAYPLGRILWNREAIQRATRKWRIILGWAVGFQAIENK